MHPVMNGSEQPSCLLMKVDYLSSLCDYSRKSFSQQWNSGL